MSTNVSAVPARAPVWYGQTRTGLSLLAGSVGLRAKPSPATASVLTTRPSATLPVTACKRRLLVSVFMAPPICACLNPTVEAEGGAVVDGHDTSGVNLVTVARHPPAHERPGRLDPPPISGRDSDSGVRAEALGTVPPPCGGGCEVRPRSAWSCALWTGAPDFSARSTGSLGRHSAGSR